MPEVVIEVLIHPLRPLLGRQAAEETMWVSGAALRPASCEAVDYGNQTFALCIEMALIGHCKSWNSRRVAAHGFAVSKRLGFDQRSKNSADEHSRRAPLAGGEFHGDTAVGQRLCGIHLAPLPLGVRSHARDALLELFYGRWIKQIFHAPKCRTAALRSCNQPKVNFGRRRRCAGLWRARR